LSIPATKEQHQLENQTDHRPRVACRSVPSHRERGASTVPRRARAKRRRGWSSHPAEPPEAQRRGPLPGPLDLRQRQGAPAAGLLVSRGRLHGSRRSPIRGPSGWPSNGSENAWHGGPPTGSQQHSCEPPTPRQSCARPQGRRLPSSRLWALVRGAAIAQRSGAWATADRRWRPPCRSRAGPRTRGSDRTRRLRGPS